MRRATPSGVYNAYATVTDVPPARAGGYRLFYEIDAVAYSQIKAGEDEHAADFRRAFDLSYRLQDAVASLAGQTFAKPGDAWNALVEQLEDPQQLIPEQIDSAENWTARARLIHAELEGQSAHWRDHVWHDHAPSSYKATTADDIITPIPQIDQVGVHPGRGDHQPQGPVRRIQRCADELGRRRRRSG